jgi:hypothetical protein
MVQSDNATEPYADPARQQTATWPGCSAYRL